MRYEISLSNSAQLLPLAQLLDRHRIEAINLTHFGHSLDGPTAARLLREALPDLDICLHLSLSKLSAQPPLTEVSSYAQRAQESGVNGLLVVSGNPAGSIASIEVLSHLGKTLPDLSLYAVYNPFSAELSRENERLAQKIAAAPLAGIYLQIGDDQLRLNEGIETVRTLAPNTQLLGCLFIPTPGILEKLARRPWPGVFLSPNYVTDIEYATSFTQDLYALYIENKIEPLIERLPLTEESLAEIQALLAPNR